MNERMNEAVIELRKAEARMKEIGREFDSITEKQLALVRERQALSVVVSNCETRLLQMAHGEG